MKKAASLVLAIALVFLIPLEASAAYYEVLNIDPITQEKSNWCWAATTVAYAKYKGYKFMSNPSAAVNQENHVIRVYGNTNNNTRLTSDMKNDYASVYGKTFTMIEHTVPVAPPLFSTIQSHISAGRPVQVHLNHFDVAHSVLIVGYENAVPSKPNLIIMEPQKWNTDGTTWTGASILVPYSKLDGSYIEDFFWRASLYASN